MSLQRSIGETLAHRQKMLLLATLVACAFAQSVDQAVVTTASPSIVAEIGRFSLLPWVFTGYLLGSVSIIPVVGKLSDTFGRKPFLLGGLLCFVAGALGSTTAVSMMQLIAFRAVQGVGAGAIQACAFATLADLFTPTERSKYLGFFVTGYSMGSILGPPAGGIATDVLGWRSVFIITLPFAVTAILMVSRNLPGIPRPATRSPFNTAGALCLVAATFALVVGLVWGGRELGWSSPVTISLLASSAALGIAFVLVDRGHPGAIFPGDMFKRREFVLAIAAGPLLSAGSFAAVSYLPTFIQTALGGSATASGLVSTPQAIGLFVASIIGGRLVAKTGRYRVIAIVGACCMVLAAALLSRVTVGTVEWTLACIMIILGFGIGLVNPVLSMVSQFVVRREHVGSATAMRFFGQSLGSLLGTAVFGIVLAATYDSSFAKRVDAGALGLGPAIVEPFEDPTLRRHKEDYDEAVAAVRAQPGGEAALERILRAQKSAVAEGTRNIFLGAAVVAALGAVLVAGMRDIPLTRAPVPSPEPGDPSEP